MTGRDGQLDLFTDAPRPPPEADAEDCQVRISRRAKRLQLRVTPVGQVEVIVPHGLHPRHVQDFLGRHRQWIDQVLTDLGRRRQEQPHLHAKCPDVIRVTALERIWPVSYEQAGRNRVRLQDTHRLQVCYRHPGEITRLLRNWVMDTARDELLPWLQRLSLQSGLEYRHAAVRRQRTLWGSCTRDGRISLNCNLLFLPPQTARYVMIHELCHTRHCNHSRRFWAMVAAHEPGYRDLDRSLREAARNIPVWAI